MFNMTKFTHDPEMDMKSYEFQGVTIKNSRITPRRSDAALFTVRYTVKPPNY